MAEGLHCQGLCLVVKFAACPSVLENLHLGHHSMSACKARAREAVYWPGMTQDVESMAKHCTTRHRLNLGFRQRSILCQGSESKGKLNMALFNYRATQTNTALSSRNVDGTKGPHPCASASNAAVSATLHPTSYPTKAHHHAKTTGT